MEKKKILLADDEPELVNFLTARLEAHGFNVVTASDGIGAIQKAYTERPDLIILDIMMPAGDGYKVCEKLKSQPETKQIPIVFLTAKTLDKDEREGYISGAEYYIKKPFEASELIKIIEKILESPKEFQESVKESKIWQILLMTDNIDVLQILSPKLEEEHFSYQIVQKKEDLPSKVEVFDPQLIVFDLYSKGYQGLETLKEIAGLEKLKNLPFILLASPGDKSKLGEFQKITNVIGVVENPYDLSELIQIIKNHF